jgi:crotonobetainyl-CoA:carnitine CoA-transferase CaiB-like acyl-CoA transferase
VPGPSRGEVAADALPLRGVRILDLSRILAGPLATMVLADLGAEVVKVERPGAGDDTRTWGPPFVGDDAAYFLALNRNKRSVAIDLGTTEGRAAARRLALASDVVVENFRPGLIEEFGLAHAQLVGDHPTLVSCSLTAFDEGERETRPGYDIIVQALSGHMSVTGDPDRPPTKPGVALLDVVCGLYAANAIQAALHRRDATGVGAHVRVSLFGSGVAALVNQAANYLLGGLVPTRMGTAHPNIVPYQVFEAADRPFVLAAGNDRAFVRTCEVLGRADLATDARYATNGGRVAHRGELVAELTAAFATRPAAAWLAALEAAGVPCSEVRTIDEVFASPEGAATLQGFDDPVHGHLRLPRTPITVDGADLPVRLPPPALGADDDLLA